MVVVMRFNSYSKSADFLDKLGLGPEWLSSIYVKLKIHRQLLGKNLGAILAQDLPRHTFTQFCDATT